jgi:hypothetical protein
VFANYYQGFVVDYARIAAPLYQVTSKKPFVWETQQAGAFEGLKEALVSPLVLALPFPEGEFVLDTDASGEAIGAELSQIQEGKERTIAFGSLSLSHEQRRYCATRKELLAVIRFKRMFRHYLLGRKFVVRTDHHSLVQDQLARWLEELSQYNMEIRHRPGKKRCNADGLSRISASGCPIVDLVVRPRDLPSDGCQKCLKAHQAWNTLAEEVDDVVSLAPSGSWAYSPPEEETASTEPEVRSAETSQEPTPSLSVSETVFGYVSGALLGRIGRIPLPEFEDDPGGEGPYRTQIRLSKQLRSVCIVGTVPKAPSNSQDPRSLIGLTADEMSLHQSRDSDFSLLLDWFDGEVDPDEGDCQTRL